MHVVCDGGFKLPAFETRTWSNRPRDFASSSDVPEVKRGLISVEKHFHTPYSVPNDLVPHRVEFIVGVLAPPAPHVLPVVDEAADVEVRGVNEPEKKGNNYVKWNYDFDLSKYTKYAL